MSSSGRSNPVQLSIGLLCMMGWTTYVCADTGAGHASLSASAHIDLRDLGREGSGGVLASADGLGAGLQGSGGFGLDVR
jgi:hypothetical protein